MITILTRTCGRDSYFTTCKKSVDEQTVKCRHLIGSDIWKWDVNYIRQEKTRQTKFIDWILHSHTPYNLYLNDLIKATKTKYSIILDDDDNFETNIAVEIISDKIKSWHDFIYWQVKFPLANIPAINDHIPRPRLDKMNYNIASCGFCFDIKTAKKLQIWEWSGCDGKFARELYKLAKNPVFIPYPLTWIQLKQGWGNKWQIKDK